MEKRKKFCERCGTKLVLKSTEAFNPYTGKRRKRSVCPNRVVESTREVNAFLSREGEMVNDNFKRKLIDRTIDLHTSELI